MKGQVLIEVHYGTINPYDRIRYEVETIEGFVMGSDGCGKILQVGEDVDSSLVGRYVSFLGGGWSRYTVKDPEFLIFYPEGFDPRNGANAYVNPLTACSMLDFAQKN